MNVEIDTEIYNLFELEEIVNGPWAAYEDELKPALRWSITEINRLTTLLRECVEVVGVIAKGPILVGGNIWDKPLMIKRANLKNKAQALLPKLAEFKEKKL